MTCTTPPMLSHVITMHTVVRGRVCPPAACYPPSASQACPRFSMSGQDEDEEVLEWLRSHYNPTTNDGLVAKCISFAHIYTGRSRVKVSPHDI